MRMDRDECDILDRRIESGEGFCKRLGMWCNAKHVCYKSHACERCEPLIYAESNRRARTEVRARVQRDARKKIVLTADKTTYDAGPLPQLHLDQLSQLHLAMVFRQTLSQVHKSGVDESPPSSNRATRIHFTTGSAHSCAFTTSEETAQHNMRRRSDGTRPSCTHMRWELGPFA